MSSRAGLNVSPVAGALLVSPAALVLAGFFFLPLTAIVRTSFLTFVPRFGTSNQLTSANYTEFLTDSFYWKVFETTLTVSLVATLSCIVIGFPLAYWAARSHPFIRSIALSAVLLPLLVSDVVRVYGWTILLADNGLLAQVLAPLGITLPTLMHTPFAVAIGLTEVLLPFLVLPTVGSIAAIPLQLEEASRSLGATPFSTLIRIVLPMALPGLGVGSALVFILSMGAFVTPSLMGGPTVPVMGTMVYNQALSVDNWPFAAATGILLLVFVLVALAVAGGLGRMAAHDE